MQNALLLWAPRAVGIALTIILGLFSLDAANPLEFLIHLAPALVILAIVVLAWDRPLIGAIAFAMLGSAYAAATFRRPGWILVISGPLALTAALYFTQWLKLRPRPST